MSETGRNFSVCRQTMAPVRLEFPASVRALLHSGELTVYDILELITNGVNALCGSYDSNMGKLEVWTEGVAEWAQGADKELTEKEDALDTKVNGWIDAGDTKMDGWKKGIDALLHKELYESNGTLYEWKQEAMESLNGAAWEGGMPTVMYANLGLDVKTPLDNAFSKVGIANDGDGDKCLVLMNNSETVKVYAKLKDLSLGIANGTISEDKLTAALKNKINNASGAGISSMSVMIDGEIQISTAGGAEPVTASIPAVKDIDYDFDDEESNDDSPNYTKDDVCGLMTYAQSEKLEAMPVISLDETNGVLTINNKKYKLTAYVEPSTPSGGGSSTPTAKQYAWYGSSATSSISNVSDSNSVVLSGEKEITITADKSDKKKCMWVAVKTDGDYKVSKAMDAEDDVVQHSVKYVSDYTVYYVETMFYQEKLKFKIIKK